MPQNYSKEDYNKLTEIGTILDEMIKRLKEAEKACNETINTIMSTTEAPKQAVTTKPNEDYKVDTTPKPIYTTLTTLAPKKPTVCPFAYTTYTDFGCLKSYSNKTSWQQANSTCSKDGGQLFNPGYKKPILPYKDMGLNEFGEYWIGAIGQDDAPYKRVFSTGKSEIPLDSKLWATAPRQYGSEYCVIYSNFDNGFIIDDCISSAYFICQYILSE